MGDEHKFTVHEHMFKDGEYKFKGGEYKFKGGEYKKFITETNCLRVLTQNPHWKQVNPLSIDVIGSAIASGIFTEQGLDVFGILPDTLLIAVVAIDEDN